MRTSSTRSCCSGKRVCDAFSENDRLIISSTRSASTRRRLRIMSAERSMVSARWGTGSAAKARTATHCR
jgi:hypothetical protein